MGKCLTHIGTEGYGIYDFCRNEGFVNLGTSRDTAEFAVASIRIWWQKIGSVKYQGAENLLILADCGGSNGYRTRLWKQQLQVAFSDRFMLCVTVCHYPPGASKWNSIEHRGDTAETFLDGVRVKWKASSGHSRTHFKQIKQGDHMFQFQLPAVLF